MPTTAQMLSGVGAMRIVVKAAWMSIAQLARSAIYACRSRAIKARASAGLNAGASGAGSRLAQPASKINSAINGERASGNVMHEIVARSGNGD
jgi:hypothetical protein